MTEHADVPLDIVTKLRPVCLGLPEAHEQQAWVGIRWRIRNQTFAHVLSVDDGWPAAYARAAGASGPMIVLMFRSLGPELVALRNTGHPYFAPVWRADEVGMILEPDVDWEEVAEFITESYCLQAPAKLAKLVARPPTEP